MRKISSLLSLVFFLSSCDKEVCIEPNPVEPEHPQMIYKDLNDAVVKFHQLQLLDVDNDGSTDFSFGVTLVGDPIQQRDKLKFFASSSIKRNLLNDADDQSPVLNKMDFISKSHNGYTWYEISNIQLVEKLTDANSSWWEGRWKNARHNYLPIQVEKEGKIYNGWIELSFDQAGERIILHKSAISVVADRDVRAGI